MKTWRKHYTDRRKKTKGNPKNKHADLRNKRLVEGKGRIRAFMDREGKQGNGGMRSSNA